MGARGREGELLILWESPDPVKVSRLFAANSRSLTALVVGECEIFYEGRAFSRAPRGVRILIYKPDGSLLIHEGRDRDPLNWQPPGSICSPRAEGELLEILCKSTRHGLEVVRARFSRILFAAWARLSASGLDLRGGERDLVEEIASNPSLIVPGASLIGRDVETPAGKVDLLLRGPGGEIYAVEVKNEKAGVSAASQLKRYVESLRRASEGAGQKILGILVSPGITRRAREILDLEGFAHVDPRGFRRVERLSLTRFARPGKGDPQSRDDSRS